MDSSMSCEWLGIDLGTKNSVVAVMNQGTVEVLHSSEESCLLKSCVFYEKHSDRILVGHDDMRLTQPKNTIYDAKRLIGIRFNQDDDDDPHQGAVRRFLDRRSPLSVVNCGGWAGFEIQHGGKMVKILPEEVGAKILAKLRDVAEEQMGGQTDEPDESNSESERCQQFSKAVITVPATFTQEQRLKTIEAGKMVFDEVHLITEAVAAAYAMCQKQEALRRDGHKYLIYDFGGGTFDTCIMYVEGGEFHARHLDGDRELGGDDLDRKLRDHCAAQIKTKYGVDCGPEVSLERSEILLERCEQLKVRLTRLRTDSISLEFLSIYERLHVTRKCFEELCKPLLMRSIAVVQRMMKEAKLKVKDIDQVLLVGGTSNIPLVDNLFRVVLGFPSEKLNHSVKAAHANAEGAAIVGYQYQLEQQQKGKSSALKLVNYTTLSLGTDALDDIFAVIIPRNHRIPCKLSDTFNTSYNDQQSMDFSVYEGERRLASENFHLGTFSIRGLPKGAAGDVDVELSFELDRDGILLAVATHGDIISSLKLCHMQYSSDSQRVEECIKSAKTNLAADKKEELRQRQKHDLRSAIERAKYKCVDQRVNALCAKHDEWLEENEGATCPVMRKRLKEFRGDLANIS